MKKILGLIIILSVCLVFSQQSFCEQADEDALIRSMVDTNVWGNYPGYRSTSTPYWLNSNSPYYTPYGYGYGQPWIIHKTKDESPYPKDIKPAGKLLIRTEPIDAIVSVDGLKLQQLPDLSYQIVLFAGKHNLSVSKQGYKDYSSEIEIIPGGGIVIPVVLVQNK